MSYIARLVILFDFVLLRGVSTTCETLDHCMCKVQDDSVTSLPWGVVVGEEELLGWLDVT